MAGRGNTQSKYCEGWLRIQFFGKKDYQRFYCQIVDRVLCLYDGERTIRNQSAVKHKLSLHNVQSVSKESKRGTNEPPRIAIIFSSSMKNFRIRADIHDELDKWYRIIYSLSLLKLPSEAQQLLPGQRHELSDMIEKEEKKLMESSNYLLLPPISGNSTIPDKPPSLQPQGYSPSQTNKRPKPNISQHGGKISSTESQFSFEKCSLTSTSKFATLPVSSNKSNVLSNEVFHRRQSNIESNLTNMLNISSPSFHSNKSWFFDKEIDRSTSEEILRKNSKFGNMIIRRKTSESKEKTVYAISIMISESKFKHYILDKITNCQGSSQFLIKITDKKPPPLYNIEDVVNYLIKECDETVIPISEIHHLPPPLNHTYEKILAGHSTSHHTGVTRVSTQPVLGVSAPRNENIRHRNAYVNEHPEEDYYNLRPDKREAFLQGKQTAGNTRLNRAVTNPEFRGFSNA